MNNKSFTLIELIIALALLAILASVAVVRFVDMSKKALDVQEKATINSLRTAILLYYAKNNSWPDLTVNLFDLLENPPPNQQEFGIGACNTPGGTGVWCIMEWFPPVDFYYITCPHSSQSFVAQDRGYVLRYYWRGSRRSRLEITWQRPH